MLFAFRDEWDMSFANCGEQALEQMEEHPFDVIVSDMRMPGMDGNQVLSEVMKRYPSTVRIILSGHADRELILESTRYAHQYLSKPCDENELKSTIERCCHVRALLEDETLVELVSSLSTIPSLPSLYAEVMQVAEDESKDLHDVGEVISKDVGMTAKVIQLVNSAFFGLPRQIASPAEAVTYLGVDIIKALVLSVKLFSQFSKDKLGKLSVEHLAQHNMRTGMLARQIATKEGVPKTMIDHAFLAGSLHDSGQLILAANLPDKYAEAMAAVEHEGIPLIEAEERVFGANHAQVAAYLLSIWALPQPIVEAVAHHHTPSECPASGFTPLTAVHFANAFERAADRGEMEEGAEDEINGLDAAYLERIGLLHRVPEWREACLPDEGSQ